MSAYIRCVLSAGAPAILLAGFTAPPFQGGQSACYQRYYGGGCGTVFAYKP